MSILTIQHWSSKPPTRWNTGMRCSIAYAQVLLNRLRGGIRGFDAVLKDDYPSKPPTRRNTAGRRRMCPALLNRLRGGIRVCSGARLRHLPSKPPTRRNTHRADNGSSRSTSKPPTRRNTRSVESIRVGFYLLNRLRGGIQLLSSMLSAALELLNRLRGGIPDIVSLHFRHPVSSKPPTRWNTPDRPDPDHRCSSKPPTRWNTAAMCMRAWPPLLNRLRGGIP